PVHPDVMRIAAPSDGSWCRSEAIGWYFRPAYVVAKLYKDPVNPKLRLAIGPIVWTLRRVPGRLASLARVKPGTSPIIHCGAAVVIARVMPPTPNPASVTTATPPTRNTA